MMKKRQLNEQSLEKLITNNQISAPLWIQFRHAPAQSIYPPTWTRLGRVYLCFSWGDGN